MKAAFSKAEFESELTSRFGVALKPRNKSDSEVIVTGIVEVDSLTGGLPRGAITEIFGPVSSGRTTLIYSVLAEATNREEVCALIDTNDSFHPRTAMNAGIFLDQLLWLRCNSKLEHAFKASDLLLQGGGFSLVVLDLGDVPARDAKRIISSWWYRFRRVVENTPTALVVITEEACVRSCASLSLDLKRHEESWSTTSYSPSLSDSIQVQFPAPTPSSPVIASRTNRLTHSNLLSGLRVEVERQKPVQLGPRKTIFPARASC